MLSIAQLRCIVAGSLFGAVVMTPLVGLSLVVAHVGMCGGLWLSVELVLWLEGRKDRR